MKILDSINSPHDIKKFNHSDLVTLSKEIRHQIIETTSLNGGHTAPNLGTVELTMALHYVFNFPEDKLLWDVSHQCYTHKLLTGRKDIFNTLRKDNGCSGFASREESKYDCFGAGHAGTAVSAALGMAAARDKKKTKEKIIAVIGDGTLSNGVTFEGLNNISEVTKDLILVLNDNKMSISENVGGMTSYLNKIILKRGYNRTRNFFKKLILKIPKYGNKIRRFIGEVEEAIKNIFVPGVFFEELGIRYIGPIDGHNLKILIQTLELIKEFDTPVVVHVITKKGKGYEPAEKFPEKFHGLGGFNLKTGESKSSGKPTFSSSLGNSLIKLADKHENVIGITAAMKSGTGMSEFAEKYPKRFFDVGIAEEHAVVFAAGLAANGTRPVFPVYSTFLQRALSSVFHDVCLQNLPVIICTDRSGIVDDGPTHHGIYDLSYLRVLPNISILYPSDDIELEAMLFEAYNQNSPVVIKYPKGEIKKTPNSDTKVDWGKAIDIQKGCDLSIWATGGEVNTAIDVQKIINSFCKIKINIVNTRFIQPFNSEKLINTAAKMPLITIEDNQTIGGLASTVDEILINEPHKEILHFGYGNNIIPHGTSKGIKQRQGLSAENISEVIIETLNLLTKKNKDSSNSAKMNQTIKLKIPVNSENKKNDLSIDSKTVSISDNMNADTVNKTIKLNPNIVNTNLNIPKTDTEKKDSNLSPSIDKTIKLSAVQGSESSHEKRNAGGELAKTLKLKFKGDSGNQFKSDSNKIEVSSIAESLKNTIKLKKPGNENVKKIGSLKTDLAKTIKLKPASKNEAQISGDNLTHTNTVKLKMPENKNNFAATDILTKTLKLKKSFVQGDKSDDKQPKRSLGNLTSTKDISSSKIIQLKPSVKDSENKVDPLQTQTIKIKVAKTDNTVKIKIPEATKGETVSENNRKSEYSQTQKITVKKNLPSVDENTLKTEHEAQTKIFNTIKLSKEDVKEKKVPKAVIKSEDKGVKLKTNEEKFSSIDDVVIIEEDDDTPETEKNTANDNKIPDLGDLKNVLDDLKKTKADKINKKIKKSSTKKDIGGVIISEESNVTLFSMIFGVATFVGLAVILYFSISSFLSIA